MTTDALPFGRSLRSALPMNRALLRGLGLSVGIAIAVSGCQQESATLGFYEAPVDPQVYAVALERCLSSTAGPQRTQYNDWDEAIGACRSAAATVATYCPTGARCHPSISSREDARSVLASGMSAFGQDPKGLEAKPASPVGEAETPKASQEEQ